MWLLAIVFPLLVGDPIAGDVSVIGTASSNFYRYVSFVLLLKYQQIVQLFLIEVITGGLLICIQMKQSFLKCILLSNSPNKYEILNHLFTHGLRQS